MKKILNWRSSLNEVFIVAGSVASALTTFIGAHQLVNSNSVVAALFTLFIQGGMYTVAHLASDGQRGRGRPRKLVLSLTFTLLAFFSVYSSALGMFELQKDSLALDQTRGAVAEQWRAAADEIITFKTNALAWLTKARQEVALQLTFEKNRERAARAGRQSYSPVAKQKLQSQLELLDVAEQRVQQVELLSGATPSNNNEAVAVMDKAFNSCAQAFSILPDEGKAQSPAPHRVAATSPPQELQKAFWAEVQARSAPAMVMLLIALLLDILPVLLRYASQPKRSLAEKIIGARRTTRDVWSAMWHPLNPATQAVHVVVEGYQDLDANLEFASGSDALRLEDIRHNIGFVAEAVSRQSGEAVRLCRAMTTSGMEIVPDLPLLSQLDEDQTINLTFEPVMIEV